MKGKRIYGETAFSAHKYLSSSEESRENDTNNEIIFMASSDPVPQKALRAAEESIESKDSDEKLLRNDDVKDFQEEDNSNKTQGKVLNLFFAMKLD